MANKPVFVLTTSVQAGEGTYAQYEKGGIRNWGTIFGGNLIRSIKERKSWVITFQSKTPEEDKWHSYVTVHQWFTVEPFEEYFEKAKLYSKSRPPFELYTKSPLKFPRPNPRNKF